MSACRTDGSCLQPSLLGRQPTAATRGIKDPMSAVRQNRPSFECLFAGCSSYSSGRGLQFPACAQHPYRPTARRWVAAKLAKSISLARQRSSTGISASTRPGDPNAEAANPRWAAIAAAHSRYWLYVLSKAAKPATAGIERAAIGPLALPAGPAVAHFSEAIFPPGMKTRAHSHPRPEAVYIVRGEQCMETPSDKRKIGPGGTASCRVAFICRLLPTVAGT